MTASRLALVLGLCVLLTSPASALLSINVTQDSTTLPGWVINTFTVDSDPDLTAAQMYLPLATGSMLDLPGYLGNLPITISNGVGDSYISINNDGGTGAGLSFGNHGIGTKDPFFDEHGLSMTWYDFNTNDIGTDMHVATLTFSDDATGSLLFRVLNANNSSISGTFDINSGMATLMDIITVDQSSQTNSGNNSNPTTTPDTTTGPAQNPSTNPNPTTYPDTNPIPEPALLGVMGIAAAFVGGLGRKRFRK